MTKEEALQAMKLLAAMESWAFSQSTRLPDYLVEDIQRAMGVLERVILEKPGYVSSVGHMFGDER